MSGNVSGFTVVLSEDIPEESAKGLADAISRLTGVKMVTAVAASPGCMDRWRIRSELVSRLIAMLKEEDRKEGLW